MKSVIAALVTALTLSPAAADDGWYVLNAETQKCEGPGPDPGEVIKGYRDTFQVEVTAHDQTDDTGQVVATVLAVPDFSGGVGAMRMFRGEARCEAFLRDRENSLQRYK